MEHGASEEIDIPRPVRVFVVVTGGMEAQPCSSTLHVALKGMPLLRDGGRFVEPDH